MPNNCLSVLYKRIIQVENKNVGLKVGGGGAQTYHCPPNQKSGGGGGHKHTKTKRFALGWKKNRLSRYDIALKGHYRAV